MTTQEQQKAAKKFAKEWKNRGDEKSETQPFWLMLLQSVFGIVEPQKIVEFEKRVQLAHVSFIDAYIEPTKVLIEQKGCDVDLHKGSRQSDGSLLTPFQQAKRYAAELPYSLRPRWVVVCNFRSFLVYDMETPGGEPFEILLENLADEYYRLAFLTDTGNVHLKKEMEVSIKAGELVGKIYDALLPRYKDAASPDTLRSLNMLCVRLVFCLYAEDAGVFGRRNMFHDYMARFDTRDFRRALLDLFAVLDTKMEQRSPYLDEDLAAFPYVNGGLFTDGDIEIPSSTDELRQLILAKASENFDWSEISPTIFGAVFESTLNPVTRHSGGMHYTSVENIHKVIDPLFLNDLRRELDGIKAERVDKVQKRRAAEYQDRLSRLTFLDPACGSGNFLTETFLSLRRLENEAIRLQTKGQVRMGLVETNPVKVSIHQFYGIEINDFAVSVATTALWIAESQMIKETSSIVDFDLDMLPLKAYRNIKEGNALRLSWTEWDDFEERPIVIARHVNVYSMESLPSPSAGEAPARYGFIDLYSDEINLNPAGRDSKTHHVDFDYIIGNPPFVGARVMNEAQKQDLNELFGPQWKNVGNMDYVSGWYYKATQVMDGTATRTALVSTNSITQGEQVATLWKPLFERFGVQIDFAYRTFRWDSEAALKAHVHCVIIGFSRSGGMAKTLYDEAGNPVSAQNINPYLVDAPVVWIENRKKPLCEVPEIGIGNQPIDGGNYLFTEEEMGAFVKKEPASAPCFKKWIGADEFINRWHRYCLWLGDCTPSQLRAMPECLKRVRAVRDYRLASTRVSTIKLADKPNRFQTENMPLDSYLLIPRVSSERRQYVPIGFISSDILCSDAVYITSGASLYHFGVLTSNVHMAWMRQVGGRLKSDYRYSKSIVYNNFPWCDPDEDQRKAVAKTAQAILDTREKYPDCSLADLYDDATMPPDLRKAHRDNDHAVMTAYGFDAKMNENECVVALFKRYLALTSAKESHS